MTVSDVSVRLAQAEARVRLLVVEQVKAEPLDLLCYALRLARAEVARLTREVEAERRQAARLTGLCPLCHKNPKAVEIEGRVLVCRPCSQDEGVRLHAAEDWR